MKLQEVVDGVLSRMCGFKARLILKLKCGIFEEVGERKFIKAIYREKESEVNSSSAQILTSLEFREV